MSPPQDPPAEGPRRQPWLDAALWLLCALLGAVGVLRHDALVALGWERWTGPLAAAAIHLPLALIWTGLCLLLARFLPRTARISRILLPALLAGAFWAPGTLAPAESPADPPDPDSSTRPDIVLITLDTFRADHMAALCAPGRECAGVSPVLDDLASRGRLFTQAVATTPLTAPSHATMLTGLSATDHGLLHNGGSLGQVRTVVDALREADWSTGAFLSAHVLDRVTGLSAGFQHYDDRWGLGQRMLWVPLLDWLDPRRRTVHRPGDETVARALTWRASQPGPCFLWVHLYDPHLPYRPPEDWWPPEEELATARSADLAERKEQMLRIGPLEGIIRSQSRTQRLMYAAATRWTDHLVGRLLEGLDPDAVVLVVADHGESLDEHDYYFNHGGRLWEPSMHVPMVLRWPGRFDDGEREDRLVSLGAVAPLLLWAAGLEELSSLPPEETVEGYTPGQQSRMELPMGEGKRLTKRHKQAGSLRLDGAKLVSHNGEAPVYYDLRTDPLELAPQPVPPELAPLATRVERLADLEPPELDDEQLERLKALGYVD